MSLTSHCLFAFVATVSIMKLNASTALTCAFESLRISPTANLRSGLTTGTTALRAVVATRPRHVRPFSSTAPTKSWLEPLLDRMKKMRKGRPRVATGGSTKGTSIAWGDYGLRMRDHDRRISAKQLKLAEDTIKMRLRGERYRLYKRVNCNVGVFISGNEVIPLNSLCWRNADRC